MSTHSHQQLTTYQPWINQIADAANKTTGLPDGVTVSDGMLLDISDDVPVEKIFSMVVQFCNYDKKSLYQQAIVRANIARMIMEICARTNQTEDEVIIDCGLVQRTGLSVKTFANWVGTMRRTPPHFLKPGISWTILATLGDIRPPDDPEKLLELRKEQERVLEIASANPHEYSAQDAKREMKECLKRLGMVKETEPSGQQILLAYAILLRKLRYIEETGSTFEALGFKDRADLVNQAEACEHSLVNLGLLSEEVEK